MNNPLLVAPLVLSAALVCAPDAVAPRPPPQAHNKPGFVSVIVPNQGTFPQCNCPYAVHFIDVGTGNQVAFVAVDAVQLARYLPPNPVQPKLGCTDKPCPRMAVSLMPGATKSTGPITQVRSALVGSGDGGTSADIVPFAGNPLMEGGGNSSLSREQAIQLAQGADLVREKVETSGAQ